MFCNYCKRPGHVIEKCYRLHGFPPSSRNKGGRRTTALAQTDCQGFVSDCHESKAQNTAVVPGLTTEQTSQLLALLQNVQLKNPGHNSGMSHLDTENNPSAAAFSSFAGKSSVNHARNLCLLSQVSDWHDTWIIDTGASDHMCHNEKLFHNLKVLSKPSIVTLPNGKCVHITHAGSVALSSTLVLHGVLYVPSFRYNLLSVSKLSCQLNGFVVFTAQYCLLQALSLRKPQVLGKIYRGLYLLKSSFPASANASLKTFSISSFDKQSLVCNASMSSQDLWHARLGHLPFTKLQKLGLLSDSSNFNSIKECLVCSKARQHRLPFPRSQIHSTQIFELIHLDLWGPYRVQTYNGYKYFLTIVDDYSRTTWTHLLAVKSNALPLIKAFVEMAYTQFNAKVKTIRSDNALELGLNKEATTFFMAKGIIHQTSCVATPQQNGVVERKHKHLLETSRALLFHSGLPLKFWGDCVLTATYLINRFPSKVLQGTSPFQILFGQKPQFDHLKVFGSLCYASTLKAGRDKFQPRAVPCVF